MKRIILVMLLVICFIAILIRAKHKYSRRRNATALKEIASLDMDLSSIGEAYLNITREVYEEKPVVLRDLTAMEKHILKRQRYTDKDGWHMQTAFPLENVCPECGHNLYIAGQSSPGWTWAKLCGRAGYLVWCPHCKTDLNFYLTVMS